MREVKLRYPVPIPQGSCLPVRGKVAGVCSGLNRRKAFVLAQIICALSQKHVLIVGVCNYNGVVV